MKNRLLAEAKRQWAFWIVIHFAGGMKALVNQVEQPFARSLIVCDAPSDPDIFSGSAFCGDRHKVLGDGFKLSSMGQAQENFAMLCSITFVAVVAGAFGRKVAVVVGLFGVVLSVCLFVVASGSPQMGRALFAMGQGLQGLFPLDYIVGIMLLDVSQQPGADGEKVFQLLYYNGILSALVWNAGLGTLVQVLELENYRRIWLSILAVNAAVLLLAVFGLPETQSAVTKASQDTSDGPVTKIVKEVVGYKDTLMSWKARRFLTMVLLENFWKHVPTVIMPVQLMAYHGWSQTTMAVMMILLQPLSLACMPIVDQLSKRFGYRRTFVFCTCYIYITLSICVFTIAVSDKAAYASFVFFTAASGYMALKGFVDSKWATPEQMGRFTSMQWIMNYFLGMVIGPFYARQLDASAQSYVGRSWPNLISAIPMACQILLVWKGLWVVDDGNDGAKFTLDMMDTAPLVPVLFIGVTKGEGPITEEIWRGAGFEECFGKSFEEAGGPFDSGDALLFRLGEWVYEKREARRVLDGFQKLLPKAEAYAGLAGLRKKEKEAKLEEYGERAKQKWMEKQWFESMVQAAMANFGKEAEGQGGAPQQAEEQAEGKKDQ